MSLGGGNFVKQDKVLPGAYINYVSAASATAQLSARGVATMPVELDWGASGKMIEICGDDFRNDSMKILGYSYDDDKLKSLRDVFIGAKTLLLYRLNGNGDKASNDFATAQYAGTRGNDIKIVIQSDVDDEAKFNVVTYLGANKVDQQVVGTAADLIDNDYVTFKKDAELAVTAATPLTGGTNSTVDGTAYQEYANLAETYSFNTMGIISTDEKIKKMFVALCKRMRDVIGIKFQLVVYDYPEADYMGVISVKNKVTDTEASESSLVYWVTGIQAGCEVNKSCQNKRYDGEFTVDTKYTQAELITLKRTGCFVLHNVNSDVRVLDDINSMVTVSADCGEVFKDNQTIRVIDQVGNDDAVLFNTKYLGVVPNNAAGRASLWSDLVKIRQQLQKIGAIENFTDSSVTVAQGKTKKSVVVDSTIEVVNAMGILYMTVVVQ